MKQAIELAIDERNAARGIGSAQVTAEVVDDRGKAQHGAAVARSFCANAQTVAVIGHYNSDVTIEAAPVYAACEMPVITPIASNPAVTERRLPNVFRFTNRDDETTAALAGYLVDVLHKRRAAVAETMTMYGRSMTQAFIKAFQQRGGQILMHHQVREGERDFSGFVGAFPATTDLVFYGGSFEGAFVLRALRAAGLSQLFAAGDGCWDVINFLEPAGAAATDREGVLVISATPEVGQVPGSATFAHRYAQRFGPIGNYGANSYDAASLLLAAIEQAAVACGGTPQRGDVTAAIRSIRFKGIAYRDPVQWSDDGDNLAAVTALNVIEDGRFVQIAEVPRRVRVPSAA